MPGIEIGLWLIHRACQLSYYALLYSCLQTWLFLAYGMYLDLCLTRVYVESLADGKERQLCAWSESSRSCVSPEETFDNIVVLGSSQHPQKIWSHPSWHWSFSGARRHQLCFRPHESGWFPGSVRVETPSGAYHHAKLSWGGRLQWQSGLTKSETDEQPFQPT